VSFLNYECSCDQLVVPREQAFPNQWASKADDLKKIMLHLWSQKVSKYGGNLNPTELL
jgi:hypothetical protein